MSFQSSLPRPVRRRSYRAVGFAYVLLCGGALAIAFLPGKDVNLSPPQMAKQQYPAATIQSFPDANDMCRVLLFQNETGRYQAAGTAPCQNMISEKTTVWIGTERAQKLARAFRTSW
jgi:hypothetical protein